MSNVLLLRTNLTTIFLIGVLGAALTLSVPVVFPELLHGHHTAHILLHIGGVILSSFITILAVLSYRMLHSKRLLLTTAAFANFMFTQFLLLAYVLDAGLFSFLLKGTHVYEVGHLLTFITLGLLALGVLRHD